MNTATYPGISQLADIEWIDVLPRGQALRADSTTLLHAGPPLRGAIPAPVRNSAIQAILYEGAAATRAEAGTLLDSGSYRLRPAQDFGLVTPLAQVVSHAMPVAVVRGHAASACAPLVEGGGAALRFGAGDAGALERLGNISRLGLERIAPSLRRSPVRMGAIVAGALRRGDECHARTGAANALLAGALGWLSGPDLTVLEDNQAFVLPILMAMAKVHLAQSGSGIDAVGGNGVEFGIRPTGSDRWHVIAGTPPAGKAFPGCEACLPLNAIGDSAVIDFCGLGAQALRFAPALADEWAATLPADAALRGLDICDAVSGTVDVRKALAGRKTPLVNLAILDRAGERGLIGRGCYQPDEQAFHEMLSAIGKAI